MARIYDKWDGSLDPPQGTWVGLVPCCGQDSYRAQVTQQPIDTSRYNTTHPKKILLEYPLKEATRIVTEYNANFDGYKNRGIHIYC